MEIGPFEMGDMFCMTIFGRKGVSTLITLTAELLTIH